MLEWRLICVRNGVTGELLKHIDNAGSLDSAGLSKKYLPRRVRRTRLQRALLRKVPKDIVKLDRKVISLEDLGRDGVELSSANGSVENVDLVVGADGIRSVVRQHMLPDHHIRFTGEHNFNHSVGSADRRAGTTIWRTHIPLSSVSHIPNVGSTTTWWHGPAGHAYLSPVDDPSDTDPESGGAMFEISCRSVVDPATDKERRFSWGVDVSNEKVLSHFKQYDSSVQQAMEAVPDGMWREFSAFSGPRLVSVIARDGKIALLGDASHQLSGAFGSGAAFALEDGWILAKAIEYPWGRSDAQAKALQTFDQIRSPYYARMYEYLDEQKRLTQLSMANPAPAQQKWEAALDAKVKSLGGDDALPWIYRNDIEKVWKAYIEAGAKSVELRMEETVSMVDDTGIVEVAARIQPSVAAVTA